MSWDEKDWAFTVITGKRYRLNLLFRDFYITDDLDAECCYRIYEYGREVDEFRIMDKQEMERVAQDYGIMIEHQFLGFHRHRFDYRHNDCCLSNIDLRESSPFTGHISRYSRSFSTQKIEEKINKVMLELDYKKMTLVAIQKKLSSENLVNNAPTVVVAMERKKEQDMLGIIASLQQSLALLQKCKLVGKIDYTNYAIIHI